MQRAIWRFSSTAHKIFIQVLQTGGARSRLVSADSRDLCICGATRKGQCQSEWNVVAEEMLESLVESLPKSSNFDINRTGAASTPYIHFLAQVTHLRALVCKVYIPKTRLSARSCAPGYPMRSWRAMWLPIGGSSNFANVILSVISGLMLVSDFGSSKITANHFAVEFLSLLVFPVSLTLGHSSCTLCIGAMFTCMLRITQTTRDLCKVIGWRLTHSLVLVWPVFWIIIYRWYSVNEFHRLRDINKVIDFKSSIPPLNYFCNSRYQS